MDQKYIYLGDRFTEPKYKNQICNVVKNSECKCIRGRNSTMLVRFYFDNSLQVILARRLRKISS